MNEIIELEWGKGYFAQSKEGYFIGWEMNGKGVFNQLAFFIYEEGKMKYFRNCSESEAQKIFSYKMLFWWELHSRLGVALLKCCLSKHDWYHEEKDTEPRIGV